MTYLVQAWFYNCGPKQEDWRRKWLPTPVFLPRKFHGQSSLVGYSVPWGCQQSDTNEYTHRNMGQQAEVTLMQLKLSQTGTSSGLNQRSADYHLLVKSGPPPIFVNKVLLAHSLAYSPIYRLRRRFNKSILKEINPGISLEGMMLKLKLQYFGHLIQRVDSLEKTDAGRDWGQEEKGTTEDEMAGRHH